LAQQQEDDVQRAVKILHMLSFGPDHMVQVVLRFFHTHLTASCAPKPAPAASEARISRRSTANAGTAGAYPAHSRGAKSPEESCRSAHSASIWRNRGPAAQPAEFWSRPAAEWERD